MAWWIHDHLPYNSVHFFPKLAAFNLNWNEVAVRRIDSYAEPKGCLTRPGMSNHAGTHSSLYLNFSEPENDPVKGDAAEFAWPADRESIILSQSERVSVLSPPPESVTDIIGITGSDTAINYRAIHTRNPWRKARNHKSLDSAINGVNGVSGLFAGRVRIDYKTKGEPLYVLIWQNGAQTGYAVKRDPAALNGIRVVTVPIADLLSFEARGIASPSEIAKYF